MSRELLKHSEITNYTRIYQDYLRKDTKKPFWLVNTNRLVRFYPGVDGLKTGYTSEAKYCLAATAKRGDFRLIAVVMGEPDTKARFRDSYPACWISPSANTPIMSFTKRESRSERFGLPEATPTNCSFARHNP